VRHLRRRTSLRALHRSQSRRPLHRLPGPLHQEV